MNPGRRGGKPATNRLSYVAASELINIHLNIILKSTHSFKACHENVYVYAFVCYYMLVTCATHLISWRYLEKSKNKKKMKLCIVNSFHSTSPIGDRLSCQTFRVCPQPVRKNDTLNQAATFSIECAPVCRSRHISTLCKCVVSWTGLQDQPVSEQRT
jgi:hypothetical protein